jgi:hypothetical protein
MNQNFGGKRLYLKKLQTSMRIPIVVVKNDNPRLHHELPCKQTKQQQMPHYPNNSFLIPRRNAPSMKRAKTNLSGEIKRPTIDHRHHHHLSDEEEHGDG